MLELHYCLEFKQLEEFHRYLALHDRKIQKRLVFLLLSLTVITIVLITLLFGLNVYSVTAAVIVTIFLFKYFPSVYRKMIFDKLAYVLKKEQLVYPEITLKIADDLQITANGKTASVKFKEIDHFAYTQNTCLIFYHYDAQPYNLIIPLELFKEAELKAFSLKLSKETKQ